MTEAIDYKQLYDTAPDMCLSVRPDGTVMQCNETLLTRLGFARDEVIGQPLLPLYHRDSHALVKQNLASFAQTGRVKHRELRVVARDGSVIDVSLDFAPVHNDNGELLYSNAVWRDVSEKTEMARELKARTQEAEDAARQYARLYDDAPDMYLSVDGRTGTVMKCNRTLLRRLGYEEYEVVGRPLLPLYHPDCHHLVKENLQSFVETGRVEHREFVVVAKDGGTVEVSLDFAPVRDDDGNVLFSNAVWRDITDLKEAQRALEREKARSEELLLNVLPAPIAEQLKQEERPIADSFEEISVMFADVVGFTPLSARLDARDTVTVLNEVFTAFDSICRGHGVEKVRTIGDGYMVLSGAPQPRDDHAEALARVALEIADYMKTRQDGLRIRIGMNSGAGVAGIVGTTKFHHDVWGDAVNVAARMESNGEPGRILIAEGAWKRLRDRFTCESGGVIEVKGKGPMPVWWLVGSDA